MKLKTVALSLVLIATTAHASNIKIIKDATEAKSKTCTIRLVGGTTESSDFGEWDSDTFSGGERAYMLSALKNKGYTYVSAKGKGGEYNADVNKVMLAISFKYGKMPAPIGGHAVMLTLTDYSTFDLNHMNSTEPTLIYSIYDNISQTDSQTAKEFIDMIPPCHKEF